jgi:Domain of unknown function (DUF1937)
MYSYLASPYTHSDLEVMEWRYREAMRCVHWLLERRIWVYSPIVHCHELAKQHELPRDAEYWAYYNRAMLGPASELLILGLDGWQESAGVAAEIKFAYSCSNKKLIKFISPKTYEIITGVGFI